MLKRITNKEKSPSWNIISNLALQFWLTTSCWRESLTIGMPLLFLVVLIFLRKSQTIQSFGIATTTPIHFSKSLFLEKHEKKEQMYILFSHYMHDFATISLKEITKWLTSCFLSGSSRGLLIWNPSSKSSASEFSSSSPVILGQPGEKPMLPCLNISYPTFFHKQNKVLIITTAITKKE